MPVVLQIFGFRICPFINIPVIVGLREIYIRRTPTNCILVRERVSLIDRIYRYDLGHFSCIVGIVEVLEGFSRKATDAFAYRIKRNDIAQIGKVVQTQRFIITSRIHKACTMQSPGNPPKIKSRLCRHIGKIHHLHGISLSHIACNTSHIFHIFGIHFSKIHGTFNSMSKSSNNPSDSGKVG